jgi:hypothetical protein
MVPKFKPPLGTQMKDEDFFPTVHLVLDDALTGDEEVEDIMDDENALVPREGVENLHTHWLSISP